MSSTHCWIAPAAGAFGPPRADKRLAVRDVIVHLAFGRDAAWNWASVIALSVPLKPPIAITASPVDSSSGDARCYSSSRPPRCSCRVCLQRGAHFTVDRGRAAEATAHPTRATRAHRATSAAGRHGRRAVRRAARERPGALLRQLPAEAGRRGAAAGSARAAASHRSARTGRAGGRQRAGVRRGRGLSARTRRARRAGDSGRAARPPSPSPGCRASRAPRTASAGEQHDPTQPRVT